MGGRKGRAGHKRAEAQADVHFVCLTGGPCGGKTTALARLKAHFSDKGYRVFLVPEAATLLWQGGCSHTDLTDADRRVAFQCALMQLQLQLEDSLALFARSLGEKAIVLCDRGAMDGRAYMEPHEWARVLQYQGVHPTAISDERYDAVLHLCTAADGASKYYSLDTNETRRESVDEAIQVDRRTQDAWASHPRRLIFDNTTDFEGKLTRVVDAIHEIVSSCPPVQGAKKANGAARAAPAAAAPSHKGGSAGGAGGALDAAEKRAIDAVLGPAIAKAEEGRQKALMRERELSAARAEREGKRRARLEEKVRKRESHKREIRETAKGLIDERKSKQRRVGKAPGKEPAPAGKRKSVSFVGGNDG